MATFVKTIKDIKGKFILSYNDNEFIKDMYKNYRISYAERSNNMNFKINKPNYKELIITNY